MHKSLVLVAVGGATAIVGCLVFRPGDPRVLPASEVSRTATYSNILPEDYVGPASCGACHPKQHGLWLEHSHSRMNQLPHAGSVQGDFDDAVLKLAGGEVQFSTDGDGYFVSVERDGRLLRRYRVTRTVGSRTMQFYIARQLQGPEPPEHSLYREHMLPFAYSFKSHRWLPKNYFDPDGPDDLRDGIPQVEGVDKITDVRVYQQICMNCHNTFPYAYRIFHPELCGFPDATVAAAVAPLSAALLKTSPDWHGRSDSRTVERLTSLNEQLDPDRDLVTLGISCESCHFGGREHAMLHQKIRFAPTSPLLRLTSHSPQRPVTGERSNPATINGICTQCHSGQAKMFPNGAATCNSREGLDMHAGACMSRMSCIDCHEPHITEGRAGGDANPRHLEACLKCHEQYREPAAAAAHSRHSADVNCLDCHMPRYSQGLDELVRTHRVSKPVEASMISVGAANACNLCHLDRSLQWTLSELKRGWGQQIVLQPQWARHYGGSLANPVGDAWLSGDNTAMRLVAAQAFARSVLGRSKLFEIANALNDPEPINRVFAGYAVERITGKPVDANTVDITAPPAERKQQIDAFLRQLQP